MAHHLKLFGKSPTTSRGSTLDEWKDKFHQRGLGEIDFITQHIFFNIQPVIKTACRLYGRDSPQKRFTWLIVPEPDYLDICKAFGPVPRSDSSEWNVINDALRVRCRVAALLGAIKEETHAHQQCDLARFEAEALEKTVVHHFDALMDVYARFDKQHVFEALLYSVCWGALRRGDILAATPDLEKRQRMLIPVLANLEHDLRGKVKGTEAYKQLEEQLTQHRLEWEIAGGIGDVESQAAVLAARCGGFVF